ncbi:MAG: cupredoxin domain-containing protein [Chloroflexi bacterium]|nr:cupredoxin domain-containing protein [Chloroflexota bacterium]
MSFRSKAGAVVVAGLVFTVAACGPSPSVGGSAAGGAAPAGAASVEVAGTNALKFNPTQINVKAGAPTMITLKNEPAVNHDLTIENTGAADKPVKLVAAAGQSASDTFTFKAGTYDFVCTVPGHKEAGMTGKLTAS